jgi:hypothetical protein
MGVIQPRNIPLSSRAIPLFSMPSIIHCFDIFYVIKIFTSSILKKKEIIKHPWPENQITKIILALITWSCFKYYLKNEQECFIRFKATSAQREWL